MRLDDLRPSKNVDDRRGQNGRGRGGPMMMGGGGLGIVAIIVIAFLSSGGDIGQTIQTTLDQVAGGQTGGVTQGLPYGPNQQSSGPQQDQAEFDFSRKIIGSTEDVWTTIFKENGSTYRPATFTPFTDATQTACGQGQSMMGPFYCPGDQRVYIDLGFFNELATRFGAPGQFAQAYVLAHEVGHHIQNLTGQMNKVQAQLASGRGKGETGASVRLELQADCYAGVWANKAHAKFNILERGDIEQGLAAASAVGDDTIQKRAQGHVVPESFSHGSSAQRMRWFRRGFDTGDVNQCDTFSVATL